MIIIPKGHKYDLVIISWSKRILQAEMSPTERLHYLKLLESLTDEWITADVVAAIEPMCSKGSELIMEIAKLGWRNRPGALDMIAEKFDVLVELNPSLRSAYYEGQRQRGMTAA